MNDAMKQTADAREHILATVRRRLEEGRSLGRIPSLPTDQETPTVPVPPAIPESIVRQVAGEDAETLWRRFTERLEALGDSARLVPSRKQIPGEIDRILQEDGLLQGIADADALEWLGIGEGKIGDATLKKSGERRTSFEADFGITLCDLAVAETGTILLSAGPKRARLTSLAPLVHIALIPFSRLAADLFDVQTALLPSDSDDVEVDPAGAVWITGSSRTADIEGILIRGVHGPGKVIALGIADA